ncbi:mersacidin/lichenicidin family type 2 lantibiotic [Dictyobacter kobayashii]|uniref:Mersacidin/lichenicidin family type 2 lantibiotic n=1 Tax=Dictyobacter kobayashii TaxID=2014872 RepID=A0A402AWM3_9CHLR|nr:mersacidin/lichenicidin family type 2 lantibiotic [Dictyobacter kobayashii]GCE23488.1 hypothetical protein KDK_72880 [Dictyobacter kobayashii]
MNIDIARAWKDAQYRGTLTSEELAQLPENPVGALELTDNDLASVTGAFSIGGNVSSSCGINVNLGSCCTSGSGTSTGSVGYPQPSAPSTGYQGGSWHLSYVYDSGASTPYSGASCCDTGYVSCSVC